MLDQQKTGRAVVILAYLTPFSITVSRLRTSHGCYYRIGATPECHLSD